MCLQDLVSFYRRKNICFGLWKVKVKHSNGIETPVREKSNLNPINLVVESHMCVSRGTFLPESYVAYVAEHSNDVDRPFHFIWVRKYWIFRPDDFIKLILICHLFSSLNVRSYYIKYSKKGQNNQVIGLLGLLWSFFNKLWSSHYCSDCCNVISLVSKSH